MTSLEQLVHFMVRASPMISVWPRTAAQVVQTTTKIGVFAPRPYVTLILIAIVVSLPFLSLACKPSFNYTSPLQLS